jgi:peptidyl-prolyl cis-trans isomerase SurA
MLYRIVFLIVASFYFSLSCASAEVVDRVVAVVDDEPITLSELNEEGKEFFRALAAQVPPGELEKTLADARKEVLKGMIDKMLTLSKAEKMGIGVAESEIDAAINKILVDNGITLEQFSASLEKRGMSLDFYRNSIRDQILRSKLVSYEIGSKIVITEEMVREYYNNKYASDISEGGFYVLQMGFSWQPGNEAEKKEAYARAEQAREKALAGENFKELAKAFSELPSAADGGDIGVLTKDEMAPYMRDTILAMRPGDISPIVETSSGYQFFKLLSSREGQVTSQAPFDSVKKEIQDLLYQQEMEKGFEKWVREMKEKAYIREML